MAGVGGWLRFHDEPERDAVVPEPASWRMFRSKIRMHAPTCPLVPESASDIARATGAANTFMPFLDAGVSGAGGSLPAGAGAVVGLADAAARGDAGAAVSAVVQEAIGVVTGRAMGGLSGSFVSGLLMTLQGAYESLGRSDAMTSYLLDLGGYVTTLVRSAQRARAGGREAAAIPPLPVVPAFVEETGSLHSRFNRDAYLAGYARVGRLVQQVDEGASATAELPSRQCFRYLAEEAGIPGARDLMLVRRARGEDFVCERILQIDRRALAERLRRWAMTG